MSYVKYANTKVCLFSAGNGTLIHELVDSDCTPVDRCEKDSRNNRDRQHRSTPTTLSPLSEVYGHLEYLRRSRSMITFSQPQFVNAWISHNQ